MLPKAPDDIRTAKAEKILSENGPRMGGEVICSCGTRYQHDTSNNMVEWHGFIVPMCPDCHAVPPSDTRRMDG